MRVKWRVEIDGGYSDEWTEIDIPDEKFAGVSKAEQSAVIDAHVWALFNEHVSYAWRLVGRNDAVKTEGDR